MRWPPCSIWTTAARRASGCPTGTADAKTWKPSTSSAASTKLVHRSRRPACSPIAEESTSWPMVTRPTYMGGLGFDLKWNMGWMHDMLELHAKGSDLPALPPEPDHLQPASTPFTRTSSCPSATTKWCISSAPCSTRCRAIVWQKFANLRALYGYMYGHPGKKLLFMGSEFGQWTEWSEARSLDWHLLDLARSSAPAALCARLESPLPHGAGAL